MMEAEKENQMSKTTNDTYAPVTNEAELDERLAGLTENMAAVYDAIQDGLYAEPGFSDVTVDEVAIAVGKSQASVSSTVGHLIKRGLIWCDNEGAREISEHDYTAFIHTYEHDDELRAKVKDERRSELDLIIADLREAKASAEEARRCAEEAERRAELAHRAIDVAMSRLERITQGCE